MKIKINIKSAIKPTLGIDNIRESIMWRNAGTTVIILKTLIILSNLATKILSTLLIGIKEMVTIKKSKIFHPSLKNFTNERSEIILIIISIRKNIVIA